jgi:GMP reductase
MKEYFDYDDINLIPRKCIVNSRSECDTSVKFGNYTFKLPVVPANMETVINEELSVKLANNGYFYVMHRFGTDNKKFITDMHDKGLIASISVGVNDSSYNELNELLKENIKPEYITIDIAHGHAIKMERMLKFIKDNFEDTFVIAGNVSTREGTIDLDEWGADSIKVGIGPGSACTTYPTTGFGSRNKQASVIRSCSKITRKDIIADGGIKNPADITKSLVMGANMVMIGGMLSAFIDSPGATIEHNHILYKEFYGSASERNGKKSNRIEGKHKLLELKDMYLIDYLKYLEETLQSSISYGGGKDLSCFKDVEWF